MTREADSLTDLIPALQRLARILAPTPDQAEDMAQEALLRVWARLQDGASIDDLRPYLMTTLRNASTKPRTQDQELTEQNTPGQAPEVWSRFACSDVGGALSRLPDDQADLLRPFAIQGASYAELAKTFDLPIGTVMSRISRARAQLRAELDLPKSRAVETLLEENHSVA
ncbi:MAG TPA: sigma-70 family RNA polymerase sigma factor [Rhodobacteraceae bacterium]|nr:sigma-70 family RNA polymerase sigma factor [Paracoccaceae bacterium]